MKKTEEIWPYDKYPYSQETLLHFLMHNGHSLDRTFKQIEDFNKEFESFMELNLAQSKKIERLVTLPISNDKETRLKRNYSFRQKPTK